MVPSLFTFRLCFALKNPFPKCSQLCSLLLVPLIPFIIAGAPPFCIPKIFFTFGAIHHFFTNFTAIFAFGVYFFLFAFLAIINRKFRVYISLFYCRLKTPQSASFFTNRKHYVWTSS